MRKPRSFIPISSPTRTPTARARLVCTRVRRRVFVQVEAEFVVGGGCGEEVRFVALGVLVEIGEGCDSD